MITKKESRNTERKLMSIAPISNIINYNDKKSSGSNAKCRKKLMSEKAAHQHSYGSMVVTSL